MNNHRLFRSSKKVYGRDFFRGGNKDVKKSKEDDILTKSKSIDLNRLIKKYKGSGAKIYKE